MFVKKRETQREVSSSCLNNNITLDINPPNLCNILDEFKDSYCKRWHNYHLVRDKIFNKNNYSASVSEIGVSNHIKKTRERHKILKKEHRNLSKTILQVEEIGNDPRPFTDVEIFGEKINGLMDSGASISVLGTGSVEFLEKHDIQFKPVNSSVKTASGSSLAVLGKISTSVTWKNQTKSITLFIAPGLRQNLYLGFDFFKLFGLDQFLVDELDVDSEVVDVKSHQLQNKNYRP